MDSRTAATTTVVVMGVSGSGKTSVAQVLAHRLGWEFAEGDEFHPEANVRKMRAGHALDDEDRRPWLAALADWVGEQERQGRDAVVTCSALRRSYRDLLAKGHPSVWFAHLAAHPDVLLDRLVRRTGHYMPPSLLESQLATLEPLQDGEVGTTLDAGPPREVIVAALQDVLAAQHRLPAGPPGGTP